ncbi:MAG: YqgE/AlgH family protein, partial [Desulfobulbia bacterium]
GPVAPDTVMLVIRTEDQPEQSEHVVSNLFYSASGLALEQMLHRNASSEAFRAYAGYAGWASGQLEGEIARGDWHLLPADEETVFNQEAAAIWPELIRQTAGQWVKIEHSLDFLLVRGAPQLYALFSTIR